MPSPLGSVVASGGNILPDIHPPPCSRPGSTSRRHKARGCTLRQETNANIAATNANIEKLRLETKADIETLRQETEKLIALGKNDIIKWVVGANLGIAALIVAALKLL